MFLNIYSFDNFATLQQRIQNRRNETKHWKTLLTIDEFLHMIHMQQYWSARALNILLNVQCFKSDIILCTPQTLSLKLYNDIHNIYIYPNLPVTIKDTSYTSHYDMSNTNFQNILRHAEIALNV